MVLIASERATMEAYLNALLARGEFGDYFAPDIVVEMVPEGVAIQGREAAETFVRGAHEVSFDSHPVVKRLIVDGEFAALEAVFLGRHIGDFMGIPATGKEVRVPYTALYDLEGGKIKSLRLYGLSLIAQQLKS